MSLIQPNPQMIRRQHGFSLIEVLIAVVVLGVGLLGLAQLQVNGMRSTNSAYLRSQATILTGDIIDSMRANQTNAAAYDLAITADAPTGGTTIAAVDLLAWETNLDVLLPSGNGSIVRAGSTVTVTVEWHDRRQNEADIAGNPIRQFSVDTVL